MNLHPAPEALTAFLAGRLAAPQAMAVEGHVAGCDRCCRVLETLSVDSLAAVLQLPDASSGSSAPTWTDPIGMADAEDRWDEVNEIPPELIDHPRYRVLDTLGRGGMGLVYKAEHRILNRLVALKVIRPRLLSNPAAVERFAREVQSAARLAHPNIVTALDADQAGGLHFLVMEFVNGANLAECLAQNGPFSVGEACNLCRQVALGLQHAHERNMVHRDIKPHNLMRTLSGQVKILDFGLAHLVSDSLPSGWRDEAGALLGSPDYIAPEQVRQSHTVDIRADLYSLGCTLFHLIAGEVPFPGMRNEQKVAAHLERTPRLLNSLGREVPMQLAHLTSKPLAKNPDERVQTPQELAEALAPFIPPVNARTAPGDHRCHVLMGHSERVGCVTFNPYGFMVASGSHDQTAILWEASTGQKLAALSRHTGPVHSVAFSPDGRTLATACGDGQVRLFDVVKRRKQFSLEGHEGAVHTLAYHPGGRTLVSAGDDGRLRLWDTVTGQQRAVLPGHTDRITALAVSRDGRWLASGGRDRNVIVWDFARQRAGLVMDRFPGTIAGLAFPPRGSVLAVTSGGIHLRSLESGRETRLLEVGEHKASCVAYSADGSLIACGSSSRVFVFRSAHAQASGVLEGHHGTVTGLSFSPDSRRLASASADRTVRIWQLLQANQATELVPAVASLIDAHNNKPRTKRET